MERFRFSPWGVAGGKAGGLARTIRNYGRPNEEELGKIDMLEIAPGDTITVMTPGGGGYGCRVEFAARSGGLHGLPGKGQLFRRGPGIG
jgi:N-methylhydantoinase B